MGEQRLGGQGSPRKQVRSLQGRQGSEGCPHGALATLQPFSVQQEALESSWLWEEQGLPLLPWQSPASSASVPQP